MSPEGPSRESLTLSPHRIEAPGGNKAEFLPQRGGNIISLKIRGKELLYVDPMSLLQDKARGGVPNLFPYAGELDDSDYPNMKRRHGFARDSSKWTYSIAPNGQSFTQFLHSDPETEGMYPFKFVYEVSGGFEEDTFVIEQTVQNQDRQDMPIAMGLHPYFKVRNEDKAKIKFNFAGGEELERRKEEWMNGIAVVIDNPKKHALNADMPIHIPGVGTIVLEASSGYDKIVVWSEKGKPFICIEPFMRAPGGFTEDPELVSKDEMYSTFLRIKLER